MAASSSLSPPAAAKIPSRLPAVSMSPLLCLENHQPRVLAQRRSNSLGVGERPTFCPGAHLADWRAVTPASELPLDALQRRRFLSAVRVAPPGCERLHPAARTSGPLGQRPPILISCGEVPSELFHYAVSNPRRRP